jgi:hypothetical protein
MTLMRHPGYKTFGGEVAPPRAHERNDDPADLN